MPLRHAVLVLRVIGAGCLAAAVAYGALWPGDQAQWFARLAVVALAAVGGACLATALSVDVAVRPDARHVPAGFEAPPRP